MTAPLAQSGAAALGRRSSRVSSCCRHARILTHCSPLDEIRQRRSFGRAMPREPASKARMRRRFVVAACADAATSGWRRHVYSTSLQPSQSTWSESLSGTTTLLQQTRASRSLQLYRWWLDRARRLNSPPVSIGIGGRLTTPPLPHHRAFGFGHRRGHFDLSHGRTRGFTPARYRQVQRKLEWRSHCGHETSELLALSFNPSSGTVRAFGRRSSLLCPLLTSAPRSGGLAAPSVRPGFPVGHGADLLG